MLNGRRRSIQHCSTALRRLAAETPLGVWHAHRLRHSIALGRSNSRQATTDDEWRRARSGTPLAGHTGCRWHRRAAARPTSTVRRPLWTRWLAGRPSRRIDDLASRQRRPTVWRMQRVFCCSRTDTSTWSLTRCRRHGTWFQSVPCTTVRVSVLSPSHYSARTAISVDN